MTGKTGNLSTSALSVWGSSALLQHSHHHSLQCWAAFGWRWWRKIRKSRHYTFPSTAFSGRCLRSILDFALNAHTFYFPYCAPAPLQSSLRISKKPFQQWNFVQRAERWQSIVSSLRPVMPNTAKRVKWCYWSEHFSEHTVPHQGSLSQLGHLHSFSPYGHLFVLPLPSLCVGCSRTASGKLSVCPSFGWHSVCSVGAPAHTKSLSRAWRPKSAVVDTWVVFAPYSSCCVCVNPWNFTFQ